MGTVENTVTPCVCRKAGSASGAFITSSGTGTNAAPDAQASHISSSDASKATEKLWATRSSGVGWNRACSACTKWPMLRCGSTTPFGWPVVPEV